MTTDIFSGCDASIDSHKKLLLIQALDSSRPLFWNPIYLDRKMDREGLFTMCSIRHWVVCFDGSYGPGYKPVTDFIRSSKLQGQF